MHEYENTTPDSSEVSVNVQPGSPVHNNLSDASSLSKSGYLSRLSSEIRTPINAIIGMSRIGLESSDFSRARDCLKKIESLSVQLLAQVNEHLVEMEKEKLFVFNDKLDNGMNAQSKSGLPSEAGESPQVTLPQDDSSAQNPASGKNLDDFINVDDALARVRGNRQIYAKLLQSFVKSTNMSELSSQVESGDFEQAARTAHSIKGASANLSLIGVNKAVASLESQLKEGRFDEETLQECMESFKITAEFIEKIIDRF